jgi:hypothetical protein
MRINRFFEHNEAVDVVSEMYNRLKLGGMIFNVGSNHVDLEKFEKQLFDLVLDKFESVKVKRYGAFHKTKQKSYSGLLMLSVAYCLHLVPPLRTLFGFKREKIYFCCSDKLEVERGHLRRQCEQ